MQDSKCRTRVVGFLGTPGGVCFSESGFKAGFNRAGFNIGNLLFQYGLWKAIANPKIDYFFADKHELQADSFDVLVLPAANQLNPNWDLAPWADFIEELDKPIVVVGLGAQAQIGESANIKLNKGTLRFVKALIERALAIGVRGPYTREVLENLGAKNVVITGCPSNFIAAELDGFQIQSKIDVLFQRGISSMGYLIGTMEEHTQSAETILDSIARKMNAEMIFQTNELVLRFLHDGLVDNSLLQFFEWQKRFLKLSCSAKKYLNRVRDRGRLYSDAKHWIDCAGRLDINIGMRIHGAIAAIQGGGLGVCVVFDSRTLELAETMGYPYVMSEELRHGMRPTDILSLIRFDAQNFNSKRNQLRSSFHDLLHNAGLSVRV